MRIDFKTEGFKQLADELEQLPRATGKNVLRRAGREALQPMLEAAKRNAPVDDGTLRDSITIKNTKAKRQSRTRYAKSDGVSLSLGPTGRPEGGNAAWQEFGTVKQPAQPFMRPAADAEGEGVIDALGEALAVQIKKATDRMARKLAKAGR